MLDSHTLGECLRNEREKRGITIEQVASATKINVRMLHALEADHFAELPAKPFVRGFVTSYCRFIGLSPREVLTRFNTFIEEKAHDRPNRDAGHSGYAFEKREGEQSRTVLWFVMGGFITVGAIVFIFLKPSFHRHHSSHLEKLRNAHEPAEGPPGVPEAAASGAVPTGTPAVAAGPSALPSVAATPAGPPFIGPLLPPVAVEPAHPVVAPVKPIEPSPAVTPHDTPAPVETGAAAVPTPGPTGDLFTIEPEAATETDPLNSGVGLSREETAHKVVFKAKNDLWVRYRVDGKPEMRFILRKDRVLVLRAKTVIQFQSSDPKSITFSDNGRGSQAMFGYKKAATSHEHDLTLVFPSELAKRLLDFFAGDKAITGRSVPAPRASPALSTPAE